jgi:hypothetical protein
MDCLCSQSGLSSDAERRAEPLPVARAEPRRREITTTAHTDIIATLNNSNMITPESAFTFVLAVTNCIRPRKTGPPQLTTQAIMTRYWDELFRYLKHRARIVGPFRMSFGIG